MAATENSTLLQTLLAKVNALQEKLDNVPSPRQSSKLQVPKDCQRTVREVLQKMEQDRDEPLNINYAEIKNNEEAMQRVVSETKKLFKDQNWSRGTLEEAFKNVLVNKRVQQKRQERGKHERHRDQAKRSKRIRAKVERRKRALAAICWSPSTKKDVEGILNPSFTSPEKSDDELGGRYRIPFIWESSTLARKKRALDEKYRNDVLKTDQARRQLCFVTDHPSESILKTPPKDSPTNLGNLISI